MFDVRGDFPISTQIPHGHHRPSRMGNYHRDHVAVFRFEVFDHYVDVHDILIEVPVSVSTGCFMATAEIPSSLRMSVDPKYLSERE